jgi:N4-gp56 family major capsid protein
MSIQNMPTALQPIIQQGFLERELKDALTSSLGFRSVADREPVKINVGETVTKTRNGLKAPVTTPLSPNTNTNMDNGITPSSFTVEQYTLGIDQYGDAIDLNTVTSQVSIANQFLKNAQVNGVQASQSLDRLARTALFNAHLGGNTRVRVTLGGASTTLQVDDIRGFSVALSGGKMLPVSAGNGLKDPQINGVAQLTIPPYNNQTDGVLNA